MWDELFRSGRLLLSDSPSAADGIQQAGPPLAAVLLLALFGLLFVLQFRRFLQLIPYLKDCFFRARGSARLENSVRISHDRNLLAFTFLPAALLLMRRYRLYAPTFLEGMDQNLTLLATAGVLAAFLLLRHLMYRWLMPRRRKDQYQLAHRAGYTYFILLMILLLPAVGVLSLTSANDFTIKLFIYAATATVYLLFLLRRAQILSQFCNPFQTFLYLCALEFLPTALLLVSAAVL